MIIAFLPLIYTIRHLRAWGNKFVSNRSVLAHMGRKKDIVHQILLLALQEYPDESRSLFRI